MTSHKSQSGNAVIIVLVVLVVVAVGAMAYLSGQIANENAETAQTETSEVASAKPKEKLETEAVKTSENESGAEAVDLESAQAEPAAGEKAESATMEKAEAEQAQAPKVEIKPGNPVVGKVNDIEVTRTDVLQLIQQLPEQMRQAPIQELFPLALEQTLNAKLLDSKMDEKELLKDKRVDAQLKNSRTQILRNAFIETELEKAVDDVRLKKAYDEYAKNFPKAEEVRASHILVDDEANAKEIISKLNDGGDFAELAKENSKDPTSQRGGDLGYFSKSEVVPEFAVAAFALKGEEYTKEPVQSPFGYHIIKHQDRRMREPESFENARPTLEGAVRRQVMDEMMTKWREDASFERFDINGDPVAVSESN